mgnify:CR=1 FL=1
MTGRYLKATNTREKQKKQKKTKKNKDFQTSLAKGGPSQTSLIHKSKKTLGKNKTKQKKQKKQRFSN